MKFWFPKINPKGRGRIPAWTLLFPPFWPFLLFFGVAWLLAMAIVWAFILAVNCGIALLMACRWVALLSWAGWLAIRSDRAAPTR